MNTTTSREAARNGRRGFALLAVLLVLLLLLVLCTPFLLMARNADQASAQLADRVETRLALDAAERHARAVLSRTYSTLGLDDTPYWDSLEELRVDNRFAEGFFDPNDPFGTMWDLDVEDLSGRVDLNSASPHAIANLLGAATRLVDRVEQLDSKLPVRTTDGFGKAGFLWIDGELIAYGSQEEAVLGRSFTGAKRGQLSGEDDDGKPLPGGPSEPRSHDPGTPVLDQRAFGPVIWRIVDPESGLRQFDAEETLRESDDFVIQGGMAEEDYGLLHRFGTVHAPVRGGPAWQRPVRVVNGIQGGLDGRLHLDEVRFFNPGTTVEVTDGQTTEYAIVTRIESLGRGTADGWVRLDRVLVNDYAAYATTARALVRRPVNLNTAPLEVLESLFANLQLMGSGSRITGNEAAELAKLVVEMRPFTGHEDFLRRLVLPAAAIEPPPVDLGPVPDALAQGDAVIDPHDALALYRNGLNANDAALVYSTMPYCFTTRDVYRMDLRATVNAPSGVQRGRARREVVELVVPQEELLHVWTRQEDWDDVFRLHRGAHWWASGPNATTRWDGGSSPPSRVWAHVGTFDGVPYMPGVTSDPEVPEGTEPEAEHVFASRDEQTGWMQLWPSRVEETEELRNRVTHFDHETTDPEGRYLPDGNYRLRTSDERVRWTDEEVSPFMRAVGFSFWVKPRDLDGGLWLDVGHASQEGDRLMLLVEEGDLVLRVLEGPGDHPNTPDLDAGELRYSLAPGDGSPGLPADTWHHVDIDVRGSRPDQMSMLVNGTTHGVRTMGMSRLTASVPAEAGFLPLESTEGFDPVGVARVGWELVEYVLADGGLMIEHQELGPMAGFGGRLAREEHTVSDPSVPVVLGAFDTGYAAGTTVCQYGYSLPVASDVPIGESSLPDSLGAFRVAKVMGVLGGSETNGDPIQIRNQLGNTILLGYGMEGAGSAVSALQLASADDPNQDPGPVMRAFNPGGGYAAIVQIGARGNNNQTLTVNGNPIGGIEVIRYGGVQGAMLMIAARGNAVTELENVENAANNQGGGQGQGQGLAGIGGARAFIVDWAGTVIQGTGQSPNQNMHFGMYVIPISIPVPGTTALQGFLGAQAGASEFAQITHVQDAELTEWVRYDWFEEGNGQLVRDAPDALSGVYDVIVSGTPPDVTGPDPDDPTQPPGGGGTPGGGAGGTPGGAGGAGGTGGGAGGGQDVQYSYAYAAEAPDPAPGLPAPEPVLEGAYWDPTLGLPEDEDLPLTRAVRERFQFRGVFGTFPHEHPGGTPVVPVFHVRRSDANGGRAGRMDEVFAVGGDFTHPGWPATVHLAHYPANGHLEHGWNQSDPEQPVAGPSGSATQRPYTGFDIGDGYVAFQESIPEILVGGSPCQSTTDTPWLDTRCITRILKAPSGERPRVVSQLAVGGGFEPGTGTIPSAVVDELVFHDTRFGRGVPQADPEHTLGAQLVLGEYMAAGDDRFEVRPRQVCIALGSVFRQKDFAEDLPEDAGLVRIGDEILAYESRDPVSGEIVVAGGQAGRGLLGTNPQPHMPGELVTWLETHPVAVLTGGIAAGDSYIPLGSLEGFPSSGTVLLGDELAHFTRQARGGLEMPRLSKKPGTMAGDGDGLFRGRYGTNPQALDPGAPVLLFPFRYWDRWNERADAPELSYLHLTLDQPAAYWRSFFWTQDDSANEGPRLGALLRTDASVPWDADPEEHEGLEVFYEGLLAGEEPIPIHAQSDRVEWRVFVQYADQAFDARTGLSHDWRRTPRLDMFGAFFVAPGIRLRSAEQ